jgi:hypothetical protein
MLVGNEGPENGKLDRGLGEIAGAKMVGRGPAFGWLGFTSNVSSWLGPPAIHKRMHDRFGRPASLAKASERNQCEAVKPAVPVARPLSH